MRRRRLVRGALVLFALMVLGAVTEKILERRDRARLVPPGRMVQLEGRRMHVVCNAGQRLPSVVLDGGWGEWSLAWTRVQAALGDRHVCAYDRAGYGFSDRSWGDPRDAHALSEDLWKASWLGGATRPFILVAHREAGLTARVLAGEHREDLVGVVLVDADSPDAPPRHTPRFTRASRLAYLLACRLGLVRAALAIFGPGAIDPAAEKLPPELHAQARAHLGRYFISTAALEERALAQGADQARAAPAFADLPQATVAGDDLPPDQIAGAIESVAKAAATTR
jgi:pimeloyl-ACP methyl ester carboxylesterase